MRRLGYKFTNKKHPMRGMISTVLGIISCCSVFLAIHLTVLQKGYAMKQYGTVGLLSTVFSLTGLGFGIASCLEKDIYRFFPIMGILFNVVTIGVIAVILYTGVCGI